jgi:cytochrome c oxidase subunit 1
MSNTPAPVVPEDEEHEVPNRALSIFKNVIYSRGYKHFSIKLLCFGMMWLFIAGSFGLDLRTQSGFSFTGNLLPLQELGYSTIAYFQMMTYHAVVMFFGTIFTLGFSIAYYAVPTIRGTRKLGMPKLANLGHWLVVVGLMMVIGSNSQYMFTFLIPLKNPASFYLAELIQFVGDEFLILALLATAYVDKLPNEKFSIPVSFIVMDLVAMGIGIITVLGAIVWTILSPLGGLGFDVFAIPNVEVFRAAFWFESHPLVYFGSFLVMGLAVWMVTIYAKRPLYSERMVRYMIPVLFVLSMSVYIHHMAVDPIPLWIRDVFAQVATEMIAVPFVIIWTILLITLKYTKPKYDASLLFIIAAIAGNIVGGATAEPLQPIPALDFTVHNTMWIPAHIHFMMATFTLGSFFAFLYWMIPELLGRKLYSPGLGIFHFIGWSVGMGALEAAFKVQGIEGAVRREIAWPALYEPWFQMAMIGAWLAGISVIAFTVNILMTWRLGKPNPVSVPVWLTAGLALETQAKINEGTYDPNVIYTRVPVPVGLKALPAQAPAPSARGGGSSRMAGVSRAVAKMLKLNRNLPADVSSTAADSDGGGS